MSTALKQPIRTAKDATSFSADSGVEAQLPPSPPLSATQVIDPSQEPSREASESVSKLLRTFRSLKAGIRTGQPPWDKHRLLREEYKELWERLDEDGDLRAWIDDKLRYDYDRDAQHLIIRMPARIHEKLIALVVERLKAQLAAIASTNVKLREIINKIEEERSWTVPLGRSLGSDLAQNEQEDTPRSPDSIFVYEGTRWPSVVLEVANSQKAKDLDKLAHSYIRGSESNIGTVIGLNIEYTPPGKPSKTKLATIFRSEDGNPTQGSLALTLDDFLPSSIKKTISASSDHLLPVSIPFEDLTSDLIKSEKAMALLHTRTGLSASPPKKWLKRPGTPVEELDAQRERKYQALEETEERKVSQEDSDYSPPAPGTPEPVEAVRPTAVPRRSTRQRRVLEEG
ncbi:hypothetical protein LTR04_002502 [Oleoguttula sp. CCFEE 6159]|nr:hypothetical protein LTR04_002502 [Oleoguttula sp. CCFEE 6159]